MDDSLYILSRDSIRYRRWPQDNKPTRDGRVTSRSVKRFHRQSGATSSMKAWARSMRDKNENVDAWCKRKRLKDVPADGARSP